MAIRLTDSAARHIRSMLEQRAGSIGLRLGTRRSGCSGYAYSVDYATSIEPGDHVFEDAGVRVIVAADSLPRLDGLTVDYVRNGLLNEGLEFINPNVETSCGCGESIAFREPA